MLLEPCRNLIFGEKSLMTRGHTLSFNRKLNSWCCKDKETNIIDLSLYNSHIPMSDINQYLKRLHYLQENLWKVIQDRFQKFQTKRPCHFCHSYQPIGSISINQLTQILRKSWEAINEHTIITTNYIAARGSHQFLLVTSYLKQHICILSTWLQSTDRSPIAVSSDWHGLLHNICRS